MTVRESAMLEMQHAVLDILNTDAHLTTTHDCQTYDYVPQSVIDDKKPYIEIGEPTEINWDCFGSEIGQRLTMRLHVWSTYRGKKEAAEIIKHMKELLDDTSLTITGYSHVRTVSEFNTILKDEDMKHYHGVYDIGVNVMQT